MLINKLTGVIFDLDNTLVSSSLNFDLIRQAIACPDGLDLLEHIDSLPLDEQKIANKIVVDHEMADAHGAEKLIGTEQLLMLLTHLKIPSAIVTRNCQQAAIVKIDNNNIDIPLVLTREDHKAKPAPDALLHVAKLWEMSPKNILYVGDYLYDIQAAINAKTMSCLVSYGQAIDYAHLATIVVDDLTELTSIISDAFVCNEL
ncbi:HAD family hydrolase [Thalassotalea piscium]|uniref:HAD superfamily hydrolase (TIGR01549 family) n=1 Tax=Thalassotalea piscium TaxID=1230533 RepID=A0A7X0NHW6_9GAMM|nr:HAD-IA family hydrolase [Thalassotalea piscium]MBB6543774.1 HAD superfamily hydrolase (TIGR01549 family) [Thalassotalea piscium]